MVSVGRERGCHDGDVGGGVRVDPAQHPAPLQLQHLVTVYLHVTVVVCRAGSSVSLPTCSPLTPHPHLFPPHPPDSGAAPRWGTHAGTAPSQTSASGPPARPVSGSPAPSPLPPQLPASSPCVQSLWRPLAAGAHCDVCLSAPAAGAPQTLQGQRSECKEGKVIKKDDGVKYISTSTLDTSRPTHPFSTA